MVKIEINGQQLRANFGEMLISVADREDITIPRFCYHKKLSVAANCRMCLVDIEGAPKPQPACSTPVVAGMKVYTTSDKAKSAQKAVMDFLLINHPLDCPICDQGGECELQDVSLMYGNYNSLFNESKRVMPDKDIGPLVQTDMTRCIHCTRCIRFGTEIAGMTEMGATGRGEYLTIETFLKSGLESELSGNMIDICPVGALTSKPFRYELRSWEMSAKANIARHDLVGSNIYVQTYKDLVKRIVACDNDAINETWISDRDRFSYEGLTHENRLLIPKIKIAGQWQEVAWNVALEFAATGLNNHILNNHQYNKLAALASNSATFEEFFILRKLLSSIGSYNVDYRLNVANLAKPIILESNIKLTALENIDYALIVGSNLRLEQPMINHRLRKSFLKGAVVDVLNFMEFNFNYKLDSVNIVAPNKLATILAAVLKQVCKITKAVVPDYLADITVTRESLKLAEKLLNAKKSVIILGEHVINNINAQEIAFLISKIAKNTDSKTLNLTFSGNALAANLASFIPDNNGIDVSSMLDAKLGAYIFLDVYPQYDFYNVDKAVVAFKDSFVIALNSFNDKLVADYADVLLPIASFYETSGTHVNIDNNLQTFTSAVNAPANAKPAWKVLKVLADLLGLANFDYVDTKAIANEAISHKKPLKIEDNTQLVINELSKIEVIVNNSPYAGDVLLRHAPSLQKTTIGQLNNAWINFKTAKKMNLITANTYLGVPLIISNEVADDCVFIYTNQAKQFKVEK